jgi:CO/xanthine dehydrogenase Mo-binding subunit
VLSPTNPLGIKAGGEGGTTPALAVIVNALVDALKDYGVRDIHADDALPHLAHHPRSQTQKRLKPKTA